MDAFHAALSKRPGTWALDIRQPKDGQMPKGALSVREGFETTQRNGHNHTRKVSA